MDIKERAIKRFNEALEELESALVLSDIPRDVKRDTSLLRFQLVAELAPKALRRVLEDRGESVSLPKDAVRVALAADMLNEDVANALLSVIDDRNRMVHDYNKKFADALFVRVGREYLTAFRALAEMFKNEK